jgi:hypothetical protein
MRTLHEPMSAFSKRHRHALAEGRLDPDLDDEPRGRIRRLIDRHNESRQADDGTSFTYYTDDLEDLDMALRDLYGVDALPESGNSGRLVAFFEGAPGEQVFDAIELFDPPTKVHFHAELNRLLAEEDVPWRILDGEMVLLDGAFALDELATRADDSLGAVGFAGAAAELRRARNHLVDGDGRGAVHQAGTSFESVAMALLGKNHGRSAKLLQELNKERYFDGLPTRLRDPFVREVLAAVPWLRNHLGGHGQGHDQVEVPPPYARLAVDLSAALSHFLIELKLDRDGRPPGEEESEPTAVDPIGDHSDFPDFTIATGSEDDIPF